MREFLTWAVAHAPVRPGLAERSAAVISHREATPSTFTGLGLIGTGALVVWLIRRSRV